MRRIVSAREQAEMLRPWVREAAPKVRFPEIKSNGLDALGFTQRKLNGNFMSWMDQLSDQDKAEGGLWYPTGNDWGHHMADLHGEHPDKVFAVMSKMSPQRDWYGNLGDAHNVVSNYRHNPSGILTPAGISGTDNLRQSLRVMGAEDDPDAIRAAFLGTKNVVRGGQKVAVPRTAKDLPKTYDFYTALRDPEAGGAGNYAAQPAVADSWMSRSMLWSKKRWDDAHNGGRPLSWPGKGTGQGLDKPLPVKKLNPNTGSYEVVGTRPANARDVAARVVGLSGGYDRMRQAMQYGAARHGLPFAHAAQAAVWKAISGNANPHPDSQYGDLSEIQHDPAGLWDEQWARRASGLHVPVDLDRRIGRRFAAVGSTEPEDTLDEGWGTPEDIAHMLSHVRLGDSGWDYWEDRPVLRGVQHPAGKKTGAIVRMAASPALYILLPHWDPEACADILHSHAAVQQGRIAAPLMDEQWGDDVMSAAREKGGFTLHDHVGDGPTDGYMVSLNKDSEFKHPISELTADHVRQFVAQNAEALSHPHNYLGGWLDSGHFYLDVSTHIPELNRATAEAVRSRQLGIYDLKNQRTMNTDEAGWLTGSPGVLGSRGYGQRRAAVSPAAQGQPGPGGRHPAAGRWSAAADAPERQRRVASHLDAFRAPGQGF